MKSSSARVAGPLIVIYSYARIVCLFLCIMFIVHSFILYSIIIFYFILFYLVCLGSQLLIPAMCIVTQELYLHETCVIQIYTI